MAGLFTQAEFDALKAAVVSGVLTVSYAGPPARTITYQNLSEMMKLLDRMAADLARQSGSTSYSLVQTNKGF